MEEKLSKWGTSTMFVEQYNFSTTYSQALNGTPFNYHELSNILGAADQRISVYTELKIYNISANSQSPMQGLFAYFDILTGSLWATTSAWCSFSVIDITLTK